MNWQRLAAITSVLSIMAGAGWWFVSNVVFAEDFNRFQQQEEIRWLMYDEDRLWREYQELKQMQQTPMVRKRIADIELRLQRTRDEIRALRR